MCERSFDRLFCGPILNSSPIPGRLMIRVCRKERRQRVHGHVGLREGSPGEFSCTQILPLGHFWLGKRTLYAFSRALFLICIPCWVELCFWLLRKGEDRGSSCMFGCVKAPLGSSFVPKVLLWGYFWICESVFECVFWDPIFHSSQIPGRAMLRVAH